MRVVYEAAHLIDAHLVRHALEQAGFAAFVMGEALLGGLGELPVCGMVSVCVANDDWAMARALVERLPIVLGEATPASLPAAGHGQAIPA
jgi:Putative prokaryotic signal transducing protein